MTLAIGSQQSADTLIRILAMSQQQVSYAAHIHFKN